MYEAFFNFDKKPFELVPNPAFLFMSAAHRKAYSYLSYGIRQQSGFILLTGEVGTGKTTLVRSLIKSQLNDVVLSKVFNTKVHSRQLLEMILEDFGIKPAGKDKPTLLRELNDFLIDQYSKGRQCVLIIDEAQNLTRELLEEVRMLSNLESDSQKLLRIILVGQPELTDQLAVPELLQLRQRIQVSCHIHPLPETEIPGYIAYRLEAAGNKEAVEFEAGAYEAVARYTRGVPRLINILCDYLLLDAFANQARSITALAVNEVAADLNFDRQYWNAALPVETDPPATHGNAQAVRPVSTASAKITSLLKNLNGRLKTIEEALPRMEMAKTPAVQQDRDVMERLAAFESSLQGRLDEMWQAIGQIASEVHGLKEHMETHGGNNHRDPSISSVQGADTQPDQAYFATNDFGGPESGEADPYAPVKDSAPSAPRADRGLAPLAAAVVQPPAKGGWMRRLLFKTT